MIELENVFNVVWRTCWQSSALLVTIAILVFVARDRIAPKWKFLLWGLVLCRLAIVATPSSPISGFNLLAFDLPVASRSDDATGDENAALAAVTVQKDSADRASEIPTKANAEPPWQPIAPVVDVKGADAEPQSTAENVTTPAPRQSSGKTWILSVWLAGFCAAIAYLITAQLRLRKQINQCCTAMDERLLTMLDSLSEDFKIRRTPKLLISPRMTSPYTCGIWRPTIVLPEYAIATLSDAELRCVLAHELAHIRRHDVLIQWCAMAISSFYWFHPAAWLATLQMRRCREGACDELVLQRLGESRREYGQALLQMADHLRAPVLVPGLCGLFGSRQPIRERIQRVNNFRQMSPFANGLAIAAILLIIAIGLTDATPQSLAQENSVSETGNTSVNAKAAKDRTLAGKCVRANDQSPVAGAKVVLYEMRGLLEEVTRVAETTSDEEGKFDFKNLRPMSEHHFDKQQYAMIAYADGLGQPFVNPISNAGDLNKPQTIWFNKGPITIPGRVVDEKGDPINGAIVQMSSGIDAEDIGAAMATTDEKGEFVLNGASARFGKTPNEIGSTYLRVRHPDFIDNYVEQKSPKHSVITLKKTDCVVHGTVIDEKSRQPIVGAIVSAIPFESSDSMRKVHVKTDDNGSYELKVVQGKYKVVLDDDMHRVAKAQVVLCRAQEKPHQLAPLEAQEGGWIVGKIVNTKTNQPVAFSLDAGVPDLRVCVGLFGPNRPKGNLIYTEYLAEVDDDGTFRMRAYPGENYPYVCNMQCSRNTFTTMKQPAVIVEAGKETHCDIPVTPQPTTAEKMAKAQKIFNALPKETDARVAGIIEEFRKLNHTVDECETWCLLMKELVEIGAPAVPAICKEFEATDQQRMMRRLAFALRAIGDPKAVPTLIRVLPKTLQPPLSDYGLNVESVDLDRFMRTHSGERGIFSFGRPVRELTFALEKLTGHKRAYDYVTVSKSKDLRALAKQEKLYYDTARGWADWWEANWKSSGVDKEYSKVNLPLLVPRELGDYPKGLEITENAQLDYGASGRILTPVGDADTSAAFFLDLDMGKTFLKWPKEKLPTLDASEQVVKQASEWAAANGADLLCTTLEEGTKNYALLGVNMQLWEIDSLDAKNIEEFVKKGELPKGKPLKQPLLLPLGQGPDAAATKIGSSFLYVTRDQGLGVITIMDIVTEAEDTIFAGVSAPKGVGFWHGVKIHYQAIAR